MPRKPNNCVYVVCHTPSVVLQFIIVAMRASDDVTGAALVFNVGMLDPNFLELLTSVMGWLEGWVLTTCGY